tara:strand:- start:138 stop:338 length:201 start_codon:yes stop_codon:yes gene_type:complete
MQKKKTIFHTEVLNGVCDSCRTNSLLVGIDNRFYRCVNCGADLEQKVNGVIKYIKVDKTTHLTPHG